MTTLRCTLTESIPKKWNHRIALFGLGGIGKTQLALQYVYSSEGYYERIYWISAVSEATLLSGFQEIARKSRCVPNYVALQPQETAKLVLDWLKTQDKWLMIFDNLDETTVVEGYLPVRSPAKHTIITTRTTHCHHIPAEGLEVGPLDIDEATDILLLRSQVQQSSEGRREATSIVKELGCLPLAIEQAAAYIRETSRNIFGYLTSYRKKRAFHHARTSEGNRIYYKNTVATTWRMSLDRIESRNSDASNILRLFAYLNPDGILTAFLERGASDGSEGTVRDVLSDPERFYGALGELDRFSFIRRQEDEVKGERITIHRLVQSVVKDAMSDELRTAVESALTELCITAFPPRDYGNEEIRTLSRRFQDQVLIPIQTVEISCPALAEVLARVGRFLVDDGKYQQATDIHTKGIEIAKQMWGTEHHSTFTATLFLARAYYRQGQTADALSLQRSILDASVKLYGDRDVFTIDAMAEFALSYSDTGRIKEGCALEERVLQGRKELLGKEDCEWLNKWLAANKEKEAEEAEKRKKKSRANELRQMGPEDYLFGYLSDAEFEKRIKQSREANKPEDIERLTSILVKLRQEKAWVNGTLL